MAGELIYTVTRLAITAWNKKYCRQTGCLVAVIVNDVNLYDVYEYV